MVEVIKTIPCAAAKGLELALMAVAISGTVETSNLPSTFGVKVGDPVSMSFFTLPAPVDRRSADDPKFRLQDGMAIYPLCNSKSDSRHRGSNTRPHRIAAQSQRVTHSR